MRALALLAVALVAAGCAAARPRLEAGEGVGGEVAAGESVEGDLDYDLDVDLDRDPDPDPDPDPDRDRDSDPATALRTRILDAARRRLGTRPHLDCSGYVLDAYRAAGVKPSLGPGRSRSESLFLAGREVDRPRPGDLAFFDDTYDRDRDGRRGDRFTHVALVESVDGDAITLLHRGGKVERIRLHLALRDDPALNDQVRFKRRGDVPGTRYLSGELLTAFGQLLDRSVTQSLQAGPGADTARADTADHEPSQRSTVRPAGTRGDDRDRSVGRGVGGSRGKVAAAPRVRRGAADPRPAVPPPVADRDGEGADADR